LLSARIEYIWQIFVYDLDELIDLPNLGAKSLVFLNKALEQEFGSNFKSIYKSIHEQLQRILKLRCENFPELKTFSSYLTLRKLIRGDHLITFVLSPTKEDV